MATFLVFAAGALVLGFVLDLLVGDPAGWPHLIRGFGWLIGRFERLFYRNENKRVAGVLLVLATLLLTTGLPLLVLMGAWWVSPWVYLVVEGLLCWQLLAVRSLKVESRLVSRALEAGDLEGAREALAMIVGRDTAQLDEEAVVRATVETVAENSADGVCAPLFYIALGGAAAGCLYKATNTMDSMVGYKNERYERFGTAAARFDDVLNFLPARLCALLMVLASALVGLDWRGAWRIWRRDRRKHASPNSAQSESVMAGALGVRLAGPTAYGGTILEKPWIGDALRPLAIADVGRAHRLLFATAMLALAVGLVVRALLWCLVFFVW